jgi:hypothetical protein
MTTEAPGSAETPTGVANGPRLRASDAERSEVVNVLQDAVARGVLTHDEGGERMAAALAAKFRDELPALTVDLPPAPAPAAEKPSAVGWRSLGTGVVTQVRTDVRAAVAAGPRSRRFLVTLLAALLVMGVLFAIVSLAVHGLFDGGFDGRGFDGGGFQHHEFGH